MIEWLRLFFGFPIIEHCQHNDEYVCQGSEGRAMQGYPDLYQCKHCERLIFKGEDAHPFRNNV